MKRFFYILTGLYLLFSTVGCERETQQGITVELPPTPVLSARSRWAVVASTHLRLRERPTVESQPVTTLWQNNVIEIISRNEKSEMIENRTDYWYQVTYDGLQGWVFGAYLEMFESEAEARRTARSRREK
ncbi:MAG: SH3 domain-containing protein [Spirochaetota bacterium]|nr:SH3 domain-containing protein [Spirochaetota bacterium]